MGPAVTPWAPMYASVTSDGGDRTVTSVKYHWVHGVLRAPLIVWATELHVQVWLSLVLEMTVFFGPLLALLHLVHLIYDISLVYGIRYRYTIAFANMLLNRVWYSRAIERTCFLNICKKVISNSMNTHY